MLSKAEFTRKQARSQRSGQGCYINALDPAARSAIIASKKFKSSYIKAIIWWSWAICRYASANIRKVLRLTASGQLILSFKTSNR